MVYGGEGSGIDYATARGRDWPSVRQFNIFLENRLGALLDVVRRFESTDLRIVSITVVDSADCAIIRMVLSDPERALEIFKLNRKHHPDDQFFTFVGLARGYTAVGDKKNAIKSWETALLHVPPVQQRFLPQYEQALKALKSP